jgi:predicted nucleic acid-binding protein
MPVRPIVIDASALAAVLFGEPTAPSVLKKMAGNVLLAPTLLPYELANVCRKKKAQHPAKAGLYDGGLQSMQDLLLELVSVPPVSAAQFADLFNLTAYDGSYLSLVIDRGALLLTLDDRLSKAAKKLGLLA